MIFLTASSTGTSVFHFVTFLLVILVSITLFLFAQAFYAMDEERHSHFPPGELQRLIEREQAMLLNRAQRISTTRFFAYTKEGGAIEDTDLEKLTAMELKLRSHLSAVPDAHNMPAVRKWLSMCIEMEVESRRLLDRLEALMESDAAGEKKWED